MRERKNLYRVIYISIVYRKIVITPSRFWYLSFIVDVWIVHDILCFYAAHYSQAACICKMLFRLTLVFSKSAARRLAFQCQFLQFLSTCQFVECKIANRAGLTGKRTRLGVQGRSEVTVLNFQIVRFPVGPAQSALSDIAFTKWNLGSMLNRWSLCRKLTYHKCHFNIVNSCLQRIWTN